MRCFSLPKPNSALLPPKMLSKEEREKLPPLLRSLYIDMNPDYLGRRKQNPTGKASTSISQVDSPVESVEAAEDESAAETSTPVVGSTKVVISRDKKMNMKWKNRRRKANSLSKLSNLLTIDKVASVQDHISDGIVYRRCKRLPDSLSWSRFPPAKKAAALAATADSTPAALAATADSTPAAPAATADSTPAAPAATADSTPAAPAATADSTPAPNPAVAFVCHDNSLPSDKKSAKKRHSRELGNLAMEMAPAYLAGLSQDVNSDGISTRRANNPAADAADSSIAAAAADTDDEPPKTKSRPFALRQLAIDMEPTVYTLNCDELEESGRRPRRSASNLSKNRSKETNETAEKEEKGEKGSNEEIEKSRLSRLMRTKKKDGEWDKTEESLKRMRDKIAKEAVFFGDYYEKHREEAEELCKKKSEKEGVDFNPSLSKKLFWFNEFPKHNRSDPSHSSLTCSKIWSKKNVSMTESHVEPVLRFIAIGALCERCENPFGLSPDSLNDAAPVCTCPKPAAPAFQVTAREAKDVPKGRTKEEMMMEDWDKLCAIHEEKAKEGMKKELIREMGEEQFYENYPLFDLPLEKRTDEFGSRVYLKQQALHSLRRAHNQPPTFIFAWTTKRLGTAYLPEEWILDGTMELSEGAEKKLSGKKGFNFLKCKCTDNCATGNCCTNKLRINWHVNKNGILTQKNGLGPCGTDGDSIRQPHETDWVQAAMCSDECGCDINCPRRFAERGSQKIKILFMTHFKGWSVRTVEPMVRGEYFLSFSGVVSTQQEMEANKENLEMVFDITGKKGTKEEDMLTIATDAKSNEFRSINHSCAPNTLVLTTYSRKWGEHVHGVSLFARRPLKAFEEITFDYYLPGQKFRFDCKCGSYACRGLKGDDV